VARSGARPVAFQMASAINDGGPHNRVTPLPTLAKNASAAIRSSTLRREAVLTIATTISYYFWADPGRPTGWPDNSSPPWTAVSTALPPN
jgi:hypothetical protein